MENNLNLSLICRSCLKQNVITKSLYKERIELDNITLAECFIICTNIKINVNDGLSESICLYCELSLKSAYYFRKQSESSDTELRKILIETSYFTKQKNGIDDLDEMTRNDNLQEPPPKKLKIFSEVPKNANTICNRLINKKKSLLKKNSHEKENENLERNLDSISDKTELNTKQKENNLKLESEYLEEKLLNNCQFEKCLKNEKTESISIKVENDNDFQPIWECECECSQIFNSIEDMEKHMKTHSLETTNADNSEIINTSYECNLCDKKFLNQRHLNLHVKICNTTQPLHICEICNHKCTSKSVLKIHMTKHDIEDTNNSEEDNYQIEYLIYDE